MTSLPSIRLIDRDNEEEDTYLWNAQEVEPRRRSDPRVDSIYGEDSEDAFLIGLEERETIAVNGTASAFRLAKEERYSDDPLVALAEYASRLLAHVNGRQGTGWEYRNEFTDHIQPVMIEEVDIIRSRSEKYEFQYYLEANVGFGIDTLSDLAPRPVDPMSDPSVGGESLGEIEQMMITRRQTMVQHAYALHDVGESDVESQEGAIETIEIQGGIPGDEADRQEFESSMRSLVGSNVTAVYESSFPGYEQEVMVSSFSPSREAGLVEYGGYTMQLIEGTIGSGDAQDPVV